MATRIRDKQSPFPMDRGIDKILRADEAGDMDIGPVAELSPAFSPVKPRLEQLYAMPNLEDYIASQLAPLLNEPALLLPNRFDKALRTGVESLLAAAEEDTRVARILQRAARLMGDQVALRDLVQMYRSALLKG
jgi:type III secretion protein X